MSDHLQIPGLLSDLDSDSRKTRQQSEQALVAMGEDAIDAILKSAHEINLRLLSGYQPDSVLHSLQRRIRILGMIKSARSVQMVSAAVADSAEMIYVQRQTLERMKSAFIPDATSIMNARERLSDAKSLHRTAIKALVQIGDEAEHQLGDHMSAFSPVAQKVLQRALRSVRFRRLCKKLLGSR